ncbi:CheR family methyltransferase [Henriciella aquimarina]|uniref:CheR family methyltransferase n=1 Tax=Henriciella aquimarina TaxID=545261 RepID=UPI000A00DF4F|nr:CheR family methyltransferase [Henriciella aquimarina]
MDSRKTFLAEVRLKPAMAMLGSETVDDLLERLEQGVSSNLVSYVADALTNGETWFFRERQALQTVIDHALKTEAGHTPRIWCTGAASGQESYSLAILSEEMRGEAGGIEILATDIGHRATRRAEAGIYTHFEIQKGLSAARMLAHFERVGDRNWQACERLRDRLAVRQHNLLDGPVRKEAFDIVLARHVLSDMSDRCRVTALQSLVRGLRPGGWLLTGAGEAIPGGHGLIRDGGLGPGFYRKQA